MPAKKKIDKARILEGAVALVREGGEEALGVKQLAQKLNCSTQPIYLSFEGMAQLRVAVAEEVNREYAAFVEKEMEGGKYPSYKAYGMAYIRFAREQKQLFRFLFMRNRENEPVNEKMDEVTKNAVQTMENIYGISSEKAFFLHVQTWVYTHGLAVLVATGYLSLREEQISQMLTDAFIGIKASVLDKKEG